MKFDFYIQLINSHLKTNFMGMQLELYFNTGQLQQLLSTSPATVLITCESVKTGSETLLIAIASAYDTSGKTLKKIAGCPTPCRPTGSVACQQEAEALITQFEQQFANLLL
jgi:hypothetical protein